MHFGEDNKMGMGLAAAAKWLQSCPTLCDPIDGSPPGSSVPRILQARILEVKSLSHVRLFVTPWMVACQVPLSMGFSRKEYGSGLPFPSPGDIPHPGMEPSSVLQAGSLLSELPGKPFSSVQFSSVSQLCLTLCDPIDGSPPGSSVPGILQARILE